MGLAAVGLVLGGVVSEACNGVGISDEWDNGVKFPDENELVVGGCRDEAANADWQAEGADSAEWCIEGARAELSTELEPKTDEYDCCQEAHCALKVDGGSYCWWTDGKADCKDIVLKALSCCEFNCFRRRALLFENQTC